MTNIVKAWHFVGSTLRDGTPIPADGEPLIFTKEIKICKSGLHASKRLIDTLQYAPGTTLCRVSCEGVVTEHDDKFVCSKRTIDWRINNTDEIMREFARHCALSVIHLWDAPEIVIRYLKTGDESIRDAAWNATWGAARYAAGAAAWDAARAAAWAAAWGAARDAARYAARYAAGAAAGAAFTEFNQKLESMVFEHHTKVNHDA